MNKKNVHPNIAISSSNKVFEKTDPFTRKHTRYIVLTYNHLPLTVDVSKVADKTISQIKNKIKKSKCQGLEVIEYQIQKEPYNIELNPENVDLCHWHVVFVLNKNIDLRSYYIWTKVFAFRFENKLYEPYVSKLYSMKAYLEYITKLHNEDKKYSSSEWYYSSENSEIENYEKFIEICRTGADTMSLKQFQALHKQMISNNILKNVEKRAVLNYYKTFVINNVNVYERLEPHELTKFVHYKVDQIINDRNVECIDEINGILLRYMCSINKHSLWFYGESNIGKTTLILAIAHGIEYSEQMRSWFHGFKFYYFSDSLECVPKGNDSKLLYQLDSKILHMFVFDDIVFKYSGKNSRPEDGHYERSTYLGILGGNERSSTFPVIGQPGRLEIPSMIVQKIFISNYNLADTIKNGCITKEQLSNFKLSETEVCRIKQFHIYKDTEDILRIKEEENSLITKNN